MKAGKYWRGILVAAVMLPALAMALPVAAQTLETEGNPDEALMSTTSIASEVKPTLEQRVMRRKEALTTALTNAQTTRLRARCAAAQTKLKNSLTGRSTAVSSRTTQFEAIQEKLTALETRLEAKVDTTDLAAAIATLGEKIEAYKTAGATYLETLDDLSTLGCTDDPTGFKASLEAAKTDLAAVTAASKDVRSHLQETIKPLLQTIRTQLQEAN